MYKNLRKLKTTTIRFRYRKGILNRDLFAHEERPTIDEQNFLKLKSFYIATKKKPANWERIIVSYYISINKEPRK